LIWPAPGCMYFSFVAMSVIPPLSSLVRRVRIQYTGRTVFFLGVGYFLLTVLLLATWAMPPGAPLVALPDAPDASRISLLHAGIASEVAPGLALLQQDTTPAISPETPDAAQRTMVPHPDSTPWFIAGQTNVIFQAHPGFHSPYQGVNSLHGAGEYKTSLLGTLYTGVQLGPLFHEHSTRYTGEFLFDVESAGGRGLSEALGLAGFTNLDVVRNPNLGSTPYIARVELHGTFGLTDEMVTGERTPNGLAIKVPTRRFDLRIGKMTLPDLFDVNQVLSDSHLQFTNWTVDNNGAWDYAADTRGYTYATVLEYTDHVWTARYGIALMPTVANGIHLDWALTRARGQNMEFELRKGLLQFVHPASAQVRPGVQRVLAYVNNAHMGTYREAVDAYLDHDDATPIISAHEHFGAVKYGFGYNTEQQISEHLRAAARFGWNEGQHESFAYTEVDQTVLVGGAYDGSQWSRPSDRFGLAFVSNAIKRDHQDYLADGGLGFILGDGRLNYGRENTMETYYNAHAWRGLFFALGLSHISSPGYNRDRGPVWVPSVRSHIDF
jgi:high affinity Mn2+ porin